MLRQTINQINKTLHRAIQVAPSMRPVQYRPTKIKGISTTPHESSSAPMFNLWGKLLIGGSLIAGSCAGFYVHYRNLEDEFESLHRGEMPIRTRVEAQRRAESHEREQSVKVRSRSLTRLSRQITPQTTNGHAPPPPKKSRKRFNSIIVKKIK